MLSTINYTNALDCNNCIDFLCQQSDAHGDKIAVSCSDVQLTYRELVSRSALLAEQLRDEGVREKDFVGLCMSRSYHIITGIYAILFAGAAYVPIDPAYPKSRIQKMSRSVKLNVILTDLETTNELFDDGTRIINVGNYPFELEGNSSGYISKRVNPDSLAYVMYTSGSTGEPKGVMITHKNLSNFIRIVPKVLDINKDDVYLQSASINYALSVRQIFVALSFGAKLVVASDSQIKDARELFTLIKKEGVTLIDFVPSHWRAALLALELMDQETRTLLLDCRLRRIVTVGEGLHWDIPQRWREFAGTKAQVVNIFGQTETTGIVCAYPLPEKIVNKKGIVPAGKPIPETQAYIISPHTLKELSPGEIGELCIENPCVGRGYIGQPDLSAEKFHRTKNTNNLMYRTGDLARLSPEGNIEMMGRSDLQIKIRGMRVELGEIESVLLSHSKVMEAAVVPTRNDNKDILLKAFVSGRKGSKVDKREVLNFMKEALPPHMVPVTITVLEALPHTPNGKIDRKQLQSAAPIELYHEPSEDNLNSDTQRQLGEIWKRVLGIRAIRQTDNFFDLGGSSFEAMILVLNIEKIFGKRLSVSVLYEAPTIEKLAGVLLKHQTESWPSVVPIRSSGSKKPLFMVHGAHGNILLYKNLAKYIDPVYPLYGIQAKGLDGRATPLKTIEEMADHYLKEIIEIQPRGPYNFLGYCMGGTIALEMSQRLKAAGQDVAFLGMIETYKWSSLPQRSRLKWTIFYLEKILFHWKNIWLLKGKERKAFLSQKLRELRGRTQIWKGDISKLLSLRSNTVNDHLAKLWDYNDCAAFSYRPVKFDGIMHHFIPIERYRVHKVPEADWWDVSDDVAVHRMEAYPAGILMEPFVRMLAQLLNELLCDPPAFVTSHSK